MPILDEKVINDVKSIFNKLKDPISLIVFTHDSRVVVPGRECGTCHENSQLMEEVAALSDKITLTKYDFYANKEKAQEYNVDKIPATVIQGQKDRGIRLYGIPGGHEFATLINAIRIVSLGDSELSNENKAALAQLSVPVHIQVFVTLSCPYCAPAASLAHRIAFESDNIRADMINAQEFPDLARRYNVFAVPKIVINETIQFEGALPEDDYVKKVLESSKNGSKE